MTHSERNQITCPECGADIDVNEVLAQQVGARLKAEQEQILTAERKKIAAKTDELNAKQEALAAQIASGVKQGLDVERKIVDAERKKIAAKTADLAAQQVAMDTQIASGVKAGVDIERKKVAAQLQEEQGEQLAALREELNRKSEQVKALNRTRTELERLKREKDEMQETLQAQFETKFTDQLKQEQGRIRKLEEEKISLKLRERDTVIEQLKVQMQDMQRKAEQGSMQLQGEVQELAIEEFLREQFPFDRVEEIKKGARGGDCIQVVLNSSMQECGQIYYESKRTKSFQPSWIEKFKADMRTRGANLGVLITSAMPVDMERMGLRDGIYICTFEDFKSLASVLRESLIRVSHAVTAQENKGDKMVMLYDYLTGPEFGSHLQAIVEGFVQMKEDLAGERRAMERVWKKREKQIEKVMLNTSSLHGSLQGIAGNAIPAVRQLELDGGEE